MYDLFGKNRVKSWKNYLHFVSNTSCKVFVSGKCKSVSASSAIYITLWILRNCSVCTGDNQMFRIIGLLFEYTNILNKHSLMYETNWKLS